MKALILLLILSLNSNIAWLGDFSEAKLEASKSHKLILINFSGSDWCGPCIMLRNKIFASPVFSEMADSNLVLVNADFPRKKKNQLSKEIADQNDDLAEQYNPSGKFPFTLLLDENGKVLRTWDGLPDESAEKFTQNIKTIVDARPQR